MSKSSTDIEQLIATGARFAGRGWMMGTSGSLSVRTGRDPLRLLITVSGTDKGALTPQHFIAVDDFRGIGDPRASSEAYFKGEKRPSGETLVHEAIYRKMPEANACFHVHSVPTTVVSLEGAPTIRGLEMMKGIGHWNIDAPLTLPVVENYADIPTLASAVGEAASDAVPGVLVRGHGSYVWGEDMARCRRHVEILEFLCQVVMAQRGSGQPG